MRSKLTFLTIVGIPLLAAATTPADPNDKLVDRYQALNIHNRITPIEHGFDSVVMSQPLDTATTMNVCYSQEDADGGMLYMSIQKSKMPPEQHIVTVGGNGTRMLLYNSKGSLEGGYDLNLDTAAERITVHYLTATAMLTGNMSLGHNSPIEFGLLTPQREATVTFPSDSSFAVAFAHYMKIQRGDIEASSLTDVQRDEVDKVRTVKSWVDDIGLEDLINSGLGFIKGMTQSAVPQADPAMKRMFGMLGYMDDIITLGMQ